MLQLYLFQNGAKQSVPVCVSLSHKVCQLLSPQCDTSGVPLPLSVAVKTVSPSTSAILSAVLQVALL